MKTTTSIKLDAALKKEAAELAAELGVSLSVVMNSMLKSFVRDRRLVLDSEPKLTAKKERELLKIKADIMRGKNLSRAYRHDELEVLFKDLAHGGSVSSSV